MVPAAAEPRARLLTTTPGSHPEAFGPVEWTLVGITGAIWGSSFLFIAAGLDHFRPGIVALARLVLGTLTLLVLPSSRRRVVDRGDWPRIVLVGVLWMALPMVLIPYAQQWVDSAVAGMIIGAMPIAAALFTAVLLQRLPHRRAAVGIVVGFAGVVAIGWPSSTSAGASALGVILLVSAVLLYGLAVNLAVPLQQRYGALPVVLRAQSVAIVAVTPIALLHLDGSRWSWDSAVAMLPLGVLGSGVAFVTFTTLVGRAGADRGSIAIYLLPAVAIVLGITVRGETVHVVALLGAALVVFGAWLTGSSTDRAMPRRLPASSVPPGP